MRTSTLAKLSLLPLMVLAVVFPVVAYGGGPDKPADGRSVESLDALGTGFSFQGRLSDAGAPANGAYDFTFYLYDSVAGGSQVGPVNTVGDVAVSAGLFTVTLDFGDLFHGAKYYLEVQVRPGASAGAYTVLSPREPISSVPNASYAVEAGSLRMPFSASVNDDGAMIELLNSSTNANSVGVLSQAGAGTGIYGTSGSGNGGAFSSGTGNAILLDGPIAVTGTKRAAFVHTATAGNISNHVTIIDNPATNNNPNAIVMVTQHWEGTYNPHVVGVFYAAGKWRIFNEDIADMPLNAEFNILVINQ